MCSDETSRSLQGTVTIVHQGVLATDIRARFVTGSISSTVDLHLRNGVSEPKFLSSLLSQSAAVFTGVIRGT